ncbi:PilZ domain-containing protein [Lachnospiraceae bacterium XBB1006]|nr:PilZ domain-containing protein [Lachnospiraceae bacterium XBB1006]
MVVKQMESCKVVLRDAENGELVAETRIIGIDTSRNVIKISANCVEKRETKAVTVLVFGRDSLYEYYGVMHGQIVANAIEVALGKGQEKENRANVRYPVDTDGVVEAILYRHCKVILRKPIWVMTKNISANGVLIRTFAGSFEIGDHIQLLLDLKGREMRKQYEIVRKQNGGIWTEEYGCKGIAD